MFVRLFPELKRLPTFRVAIFAKDVTVKLAVVTVFETTRFASDPPDVWTFVRLFPDPKSLSTFKVKMFAVPYKNIFEETISLNENKRFVFITFE